MSFQVLLHRKLSVKGGILVAQELERRLKLLREQGTKLPLAVDAEAEKVLAQGKALEPLSSDVSMNTIDQGTDRMIAGFFGLFSARELCYTFSEVISLEPAEKEAFRLCNKTKTKLFPDGTKFVQESHENQWKHLQKLQSQLTTPEIQAALYGLGMSKEAERLLRWIEAYGARLGATQTRSARDQHLMVAIAGFHSAWEDFTVEVRHAFKDHSAESNRICLMLLSPYDRQLEKEEEIMLQSSGLQATIKK